MARRRVCTDLSPRVRPTRGFLLVAPSVALLLTACQGLTGYTSASRFADCPAAMPAFQVTDDFMRTFNSKDANLFGGVFHFPSVRIASGNVTIINSPADLETSFSRLAEAGWDRSAWAKREIVQCEATKAHMLTTFVRYRADGTEISRFDSLYIIERRNGRWGLTARSSFAP